MQHEGCGKQSAAFGTADQQPCNIKDAASNPVPSCPTVANFMGEYDLYFRNLHQYLYL